MRRPLLTALAAAVTLLSVVGCGAGGLSAQAQSTTVPTRAATPPAGPCGVLASPPRYQHVIWIWMDNQTWGQVLGTPTTAPNEVAMAHLCGTAVSYSSVGSPSLPNDIGATSGGTQGLSDDDGPTSHPLTTNNIFRQVRAAGGTERSYEESMPTNCQLASTSLYADYHNPAAYYTGGDDRQACERDDLPLLSFFADLVNGNVPTFAFIAPNLCNDTVNCTVVAGDRWLGGVIPRILNSPEYRARRTAIFVIWGETSPMPNLIISPSTKPGTVVRQPLDHYSLLRTTEELLHLPLLGAAARATSMTGPFHL